LSSFEFYRRWCIPNFLPKNFQILDCYYAGAKTDEDRHILTMMAKDFEDYMFNSGAFSKRFHESFGKDVPNDYPRHVMEAHGLAHVHIFDAEAMTDEAIEEWDKNNFPRRFIGRRGTSDLCMVYTLGSEGTVLLLAFFAPPAHEKHDDCDYINTLIRAANDFFQEQDNGEYVLPRSRILDILAA
jgi:hypothetical protein